MGHSQGSHRAPRGSRRTVRAVARVPVPPRLRRAPSTRNGRSSPGGRRTSRRSTTPPSWTPRCSTPPPAPRRKPAYHRAAPRHRGAPESLRRIVPRALVVAVLVGGTVAFLVQGKAVRVSVDGTSRTLHTFADDVGELLDAEGVTVGARDTVAPAPATGLDDGDEIVVRRGTHVSGPARGRAPRVPRRP